MGGYGSGRAGGRPTTQDGLTLDLPRLFKQRSLQPGCTRAGTLTWTNTRTGAHVASIGYGAELDATRGRMRLHYTTTRSDGEAHKSDYWVDLATTPQPFGGHRWWFICPRLGICVAKLHLPPGALSFASRKAYRLGYRSQRETSRDRALSRAYDLRYRLGAEGIIGDRIAKPKGMRWATFAREMERVAEAEAVCTGNLIAVARKFGLQV
ncbi:hypothetical protein [Methylobacterium trifolii]|uniref:Uncharacterized protein n=1 Tax=Methylobacterium trifolii TaxID=1003092 RepID=A0ABQ4TZ12_9HYPH|nr:hypothetical protein [Methylobacterium trifolii]GJE59100.1 hypothetical protein MPOCJGCO_1187 [Methylobacterium trifolii]